jgi:hypothetical protein
MRQICKTIIIVLITFSCSSNNQNSDTMNDKFTWNIQFAGYDFNQYDEKGEINFENFVKEFDKFPWIEQIEYFQKKHTGCSATISVKDLKIKQDFWVSIAGDIKKHAFLIGYVYPKEVKGFFGLGKPKTVRWVEIYITEDQNVVKKSFRLFFDRQNDELISSIRKLEKFGEMKAQN